MARTSCPACGSEALSEIYRLDTIPVQSCVLLETESEAYGFERAPLVLAFCDGCGLVFNTEFVLEHVDYASATEESQHFSGTFNTFAKGLVTEIKNLSDLRGKQVLEVGCGKGDFLQELVLQTGARGLGVDPGFIPERLPGVDGQQIDFVRAYFQPDQIYAQPDYVVCRHTLEHIPEVGTFMADIVKAAGPDAAIFFETPDVARVLDEGAFWDIYYEHCSYFTLGSHARAFRAAGLGVTKMYLAYEGQYIIMYGQRGDTPVLPQENDMDRLRALATAFPAKVHAIRDHWRSFVAKRHGAGKKVAVWGGGSKCVSFLTTDGLGPMVSQVVDINPFKQGKYLPGAGHRVVAPETLKQAPPDTVIVMNPVYLPEIGAQLSEMGLTPELVAV